MQCYPRDTENIVPESKIGSDNSSSFGPNTRNPAGIFEFIDISEIFKVNALPCRLTSKTTNRSDDEKVGFWGAERTSPVFHPWQFFCATGTGGSERT